MSDPLAAPRRTRIQEADAAPAETIQPALLSYRDFRVRPHHCFACGELNDVGLHLELHLSPGHCHTEITLPRQFEGWEGIVHGGILCTILDEVMAWSLVERDNWGVTARMSIQFKKPALVGHHFEAEGWMVEDRRRIHRTEGRIVDADTGDEVATAEATYVAATGDKKRELKERYGVIAGPAYPAAQTGQTGHGTQAVQPTSGTGGSPEAAE
jgi:acyl-coenzyme A thioesterase PaaI-like protein